MLAPRIISKSRYYLPYLTQQRFMKVRILPIKYDEFETPFMKTRKPGESILTNFYAFVNRKWTFADIKNYQKWKRMDVVRNSQRYISERHKILGPDLATSHFLLTRGGKVKFKGQNEWMTNEHLSNGQIPSSYVPGFFVEEIDATESMLLYEGFENLCNLQELKKLILHNCPFVDDWCLNRMYIFADTLEYLDLSGWGKIF
ncbi:Distal membrane-arm assembly complex protein like [Argiope bruennichi]|uniref:Distal membrane-arm assembly complex protein like n=1 Tax=Argiope bruennichi TaxID=94029 RepID=A0A8T0E122_ARGBR|nr:Distal membrane-arm assembly complex protein like [Argiope bruennichi]